ncbi:MAG TPA: alpha amylase C-terminal domain-containing protein, partial [Propionibacteriaceae bacterium]|nr:alpha amylase C-terminal domain-containing protein [Propionibacteriaceae bacterium]
NDPAGFAWINADDNTGNTFSWVRKSSDGQMVACFANFSPEPHANYAVALPTPGVWREILNTGATEYDGDGTYGNLGQIIAREGASPWGNGVGAQVVVPPMGAVWLKFDPDATAALPGDTLQA